VLEWFMKISFLVKREWMNFNLMITDRYPNAPLFAWGLHSMVWTLLCLVYQHLYCLNIKIIIN